MNSADYWISKYQMQKHPEGGHFAEVHRSPLRMSADCLPPAYGGARASSTSIYFLLEKREISAAHRLKGEEIWYYHAGASLDICGITATGAAFAHRLGLDGDLQVVVPAMSWFGAYLTDQEGFALVGCNMAPGFDFHDWELARPTQLLQDYPQHKDLIQKITHL